MKNYLKRKIFLLLFIITIIFNSAVYATSIQSFRGYTGTVKLLNDLTVALMVMLPIVTVVLVVYFNMRKAGAEQQEQQMWGKRIKIAIGCAIFGEVASGLVNLIASYYGG